MNRQYPAYSEYLLENLDDIAARAVEGDTYHSAIEAAPADVVVALSAPNMPVDVAVSFGKPFATSPVIMVTLTAAGNAGAYINLVAVNVTTTGFTLRAASGAAQSISCRWLAYGRRQ